jgi:hypothetical protein
MFWYISGRKLKAHVFNPLLSVSSTTSFSSISIVQRYADENRDFSSRPIRVSEGEEGRERGSEGHCRGVGGGGEEGREKERKRERGGGGRGWA